MVPRCSLVLLLGECNDVAGNLSATATSRADCAMHVWRQLDAQSPGSAFLAAGSGRGPHFNLSDTPHYELQRRYLMGSKGLPEVAWVTGWPSEHTVSHHPWPRTHQNLLQKSRLA